MDSTHLRAHSGAADEPICDGRAWLRRRRRRRRRFALELDRRGLFLRLGGTEAYLCADPASAWACEYGPDGLDVRAWRLHLIVGRVPVGDRRA